MERKVGKFGQREATNIKKRTNKRNNKTQRLREKQNKKERETQKDKKDSTSKQCCLANKPHFRPGGVRACFE